MKTVLIGASAKPHRYAYMATQRLLDYKHDVVLIGLRKQEILGLTVHTEPPKLENVSTVTLYLNPTNQLPYIDYILELKPQRIIFNPGTENPNLVEKAQKLGIEAIYGCTLVMLSAGTY